MTGILWVFLSGVLVAFNVLLKGIFAPLARDIVSTYSLLNLDTDTFVGRQFDSLVLLWIILLVSPLMLKRNLYALRHICYVGFTSVCVIMISIGVRAFQRNQSIEQGHIPAGLIGDNVQIKYFTDSWTDALFAFPIIVLAFLCSYNMVEVHGVGSVLKQISYLSPLFLLKNSSHSNFDVFSQALQDPTRERVKSVIHVSITSCFTLFQAFGFAGYFYAYDACKGNIFLNFSE
jgi:amino acid permease